MGREGGEGESGFKFSGQRRERLKGGWPERPLPGQDLASKVPRAVPLGAPAFGHLRGSFGSFRQFQFEPCTPSARYPPPHAVRFLWARAAPHVDAKSRPTRPHFYLVCSRPTLPTPPLPRYPNPRRPRSSLNSGARPSGRCEARETQSQEER